MLLSSCHRVRIPVTGSSSVHETPWTNYMMWKAITMTRVNTVRKGQDVLFFHSSWSLGLLMYMFPWKPLGSEIWEHHKVILEVWLIISSLWRTEAVYGDIHMFRENFPSRFLWSDRNNSFWKQNQPDPRSCHRWVLRIAVVFRFFLSAFVHVVRNEPVSVSLRVGRQICHWFKQFCTTLMLRIT